MGGVIGPGFTLLPETFEETDNIETMVFKKWDIRQQRRVIPERWEINQVIALAYCFERISRLLHRERIINRTQSSSWVEETVLRGSGDEGSWSLLDRVPEGRTDQQDILEICRGFSLCVFSGVMISAREETTWGQGKNQPKWLEGTLACIHTGPRIVFPKARLENLKIPGILGRVFWKVLLQQ